MKKYNRVGLSAIGKYPDVNSIDMHQHIRGFLNVMRYINPRFTYFTYLLTYLSPLGSLSPRPQKFWG